MLSADPHESDESYARRLQAVELGMGLGGQQHLGRNYQPVPQLSDLPANANTPLMAMVSVRSREEGRECRLSCSRAINRQSAL